LMGGCHPIMHANLGLQDRRTVRQFKVRHSYMNTAESF
jgi:hypothetical protein